MEKVAEHCTMTVQGAAYIILRSSADMSDGLAKAWAKAAEEAVARACGVVFALRKRVTYDYWMMNHYSEALLKRELQKYNRHIEQQGEPWGMRKSDGTEEDFFGLLKTAKEKGCAHLTEENKERFACDLVWRNTLYEVLTASEAAWGDMEPEKPWKDSELACALLLAVWMREHTGELGRPDCESLAAVALKIACLDQLRYPDSMKILKLKFAVRRYFEAME